MSQVPDNGLPVINETTRNYLDAVYELARNLRDRTRLESDTTIKQAESLLRDYGQYALAALGGAITIETVGRHLVKSKPLFFMGAVILIFAVIISFITRSQLHARINEFRIKVEGHFEKVDNKIRSYLINPTLENMGALQEAALFNENPRENWLTKNGVSLTGVLFFVGFLSIAISLIFSIST